MSTDTSNPIKVSPEKCNLIEVKDTDLKIAITNMLEIIKEIMYKFLYEIYENTKTRMKEKNSLGFADKALEIPRC